MSSAAKPTRRTSPGKPAKQTPSKTSETPSDAHQSTAIPAIDAGNGAIEKNKAGKKRQLAVVLLALSSVTTNNVAFLAWKIWSHVLL
jgi:hypothetical protein